MAGLASGHVSGSGSGSWCCWHPKEQSAQDQRISHPCRSAGLRYSCVPCSFVLLLAGVLFEFHKSHHRGAQDAQQHFRLLGSRLQSSVVAFCADLSWASPLSFNSGVMSVWISSMVFGIRSVSPSSASNCFLGLCRPLAINMHHASRCPCNRILITLASTYN